MSVRILTGDVREVLKTLPDESVHCVVTSPPYFGLRSYLPKNHPQKHLEIGTEKTPAAFVETMVSVFREVHRVLRNDGTLWLNLGDSYAGSWGAQSRGEAPGPASKLSGGQVHAMPKGSHVGSLKRTPGLKAKDLIGIPWSVAKALQAPYYTGRIAAERDRVWLAAIMDGEGTICGFDHDRADNGTHRSGIHVFMTNSSTALLDEAARIWPTSRSEHGRPGPGHLGDLPTWRWIVHGIANKQAVLREIYPHLIAKRHQAVVAYSMLLLMENAKRLGHSTLKDETIAKRAICTALLSDLNHQRPVVMPDWLTEPPTMFEPGWYLRQDIIWSKPNPMPESVTDRCTKAHEYIFMMSKSKRYYFDAAAIAENRIQDEDANSFRGGCYVGNKSDNKTLGKRQVVGNRKRGVPPRHSLYPSSDRSGLDSVGRGGKRNKRSVWEIATSPYPEAHYATFPPALAEPCILAGCPKGGTALDCFGGAGTTGLVADRLERNAILIDLDPLNSELARRRVVDDSPLFAAVS